ncbi:Flp pilus assembly protein CpaB [Altericroceibacterium endophyticum]|uniref:Flp pilus assembly protein CpaB n=1 Tax=Altericroceibacterium endophyticum TaxID=1808508 RepID=A0A6I4T6G5_9SPHN|nr:Flp pilus assembly protein CpaB [Altericroceibacterium endophyticum]MXO66506.1 Flp pilus assembly protein CpaB [Altericroceibacterium endophyticum]
MDRRKLVLLIGALIIAIGTAMAARSIFAGSGAPEAEAVMAEPQGPKVLVAQRSLPVGTILTADSVSFQLWPKELVKDAYYIDGEADIQSLLGTVVRNPITAGEPITQGTLVAPGDRGFLAAALTPGMRAVTVPVSAQTGVAGFIFPGDRVDLMLTQSVEGDGRALHASETILRNLRVLATDQSTETTKGDDGKTQVRTFSLVTLEVTPRIAEKISVAQTIGELSFSLRSLADNRTELERAIASGDVSVPDNATPEEEAAILEAASSRPEDGRSTYVTGGDVSRFQRSSIPPQNLAANNNVAPPPTAMAAAPAAQQSSNNGPVVRVTRGENTVEVPLGN